jgi:poly(A) polymerase
MIKLKELIHEGKYKDVIVGYISMDGIIKSELSSKTHNQLGFSRGTCWRFAFENSTVYWHGDESEHNEVDEINVATHLEDKYDVTVKRNVTTEADSELISPDTYWNNHSIAHGIMEDRSNKTVEYGCLMAYICQEDTDKLNELNDLLIPEDILYKKDGEFGREGECHVTCKYGFTKDLTKEDIIKLTSDLNIFEISLKSISTFKNAEEGFDVVKFDVDSDIINELNKKACEFPNEDSHPNFHAHLTLGYVNPGTFKKEKKNLNIKVKIDEIVYSPIEGEKIHLKLTNKKEKLDEGLRLDFLNTEIPRLEKEWERIDSMGGRELEQQRISKLLQQYRLEKKNWDNVYKAIMKESIYDGYEVNLRNETKYVEVFINPSSKELRECIEHDQYALLLTDKDAYSWNRMLAYHEQIRVKDKIFRNAVSLLVWPEGNFNTVSVMVTDNTRDTTWNENPNTEKFIRNHPFFKGKTINDILYWNQDIVGDWSSLLKEGLIMEGKLEETAEDFIKQIIKGTEWDGIVYACGGYVRDQISGRDAKDLDIVVDKENGGILFSNWITKKIGNYKEHSNPVTFEKFGTSKFNLNGIIHNGINLNGFEIEAVMPRSEKYTVGSRHPEVQSTTLKGDAERRDITYNSLYKNISTGKILDLTGKGIEDLKNGIIRTPIDPDKTFKDDPLRQLRIVRFYAKYGHEIPLYIIKSLKRNAGELKNISAERIQSELNKMLVTTRPEKALKLLKITGLLDYIIPEFKATYKLGQNQFHKSDVWLHSIEVMKKTKPELLNRWVSLLHDIGKTKTKTVVDGEVHFYAHEKVGSEMAKEILTRLKYPTEIIDAVVIGIANHMRLKRSGDNGEVATDKTLRKFTVDLGDHLETMLDVMESDNASHEGSHTMPNQIPGIRARIDKLRNTIPAKNAKLPVTGEDLKNLGLKQGPLFKELLDLVKDQQLENPNTSKEEYLDLIKAHLSSKS